MRAVVGLNGGPTDDKVVQIACQLAKPRNAELIAVHVVEVDWTHELSDDMDGREEAAAILDHAEAIAERYKVRLQAELLQARDVGAALVDEAVELGADTIFIGAALSQALRWGLRARHDAALRAAERAGAGARRPRIGRRQRAARRPADSSLPGRQHQPRRGSLSGHDRCA